eukprot:CAMPEP_0176121114 /NCGR_PEP_ID=MMETSP0120_2-20121206/60948_1 /TAXON_ID=160619 /ORGANISM="Kryptoperidinium foliaceum, Strain CCMP 1326" /LENGTH=192 /DNA_ID=CAMNT_0017455629 /DNA_START=13 /DNA_END=591 /DNA_ORIENTATION=+
MTRAESLGDGSPCLLVDAGSPALEVMSATSAWIASCGEPQETLCDVLSSRCAEYMKGRLEKMICEAVTGGFSTDTCHFVLKGLRARMADGTVCKLSLGVVLLQPELWEDSRCPALVTLLKMLPVRRRMRSEVLVASVDDADPRTRAVAAPRMDAIPEESEASGTEASLGMVPSKQLRRVDFASRRERQVISL